MRPQHALTARTASHQAGFSMIYAIVALVALSTLAAAMASLTQTGAEVESSMNAIARARYMALAGFNYVRQFREDYVDLQGTKFSFGAAGEFEITHVQKYVKSGNDILARVVGRVNAGTPYESNYVVYRTFDSEDPMAITFRSDFPNFKTQTSDPSKSPVTKNPDKTFTIGSDENYAFGSMYYTGDKEMNWGANVCNFSDPSKPVGCDFKQGFRLFFVSEYLKNVADGIVFTMFGTNSTAGLNKYYSTPVTVYYKSGSPVQSFTSVGGDSALGEMIGYAGDGRFYAGSNGTYSSSLIGWLDPEQNGIQPPKIGIEFDNYPNTGTGSICSTNTSYWGNAPSTSQRKDSSGDHIAYVFWGNKGSWTDECAMYNAYSYSTQTKYSDGTHYANDAGISTYDDNRHGDGDNVSNSSTTGYWKSTFDWKDNPFAFRAEIQRSTVPNASGLYEYTITSWIRRCTYRDAAGHPCIEYFDIGSPDTDKNKIYFSDTSRFLCHSGSGFATGKCSNYNTPILQQTVQLTATEHDNFTKMIFGFTEATGGATQVATYSEFILQFIKPNDYDVSGDKRRVINYTVN